MSGPEGCGPGEHNLPLVAIEDRLRPCPYRHGVTARMPLELPFFPISPVTAERLLDGGYRRSGMFLYRTRCPDCVACEPTRIELDRFRLRPSMRRVLRRGGRDLQCRWGRPQVDDERVELFNRHRRLRGLGSGQAAADSDDYRGFLVETPLDSWELAIEREGRLVGVAIVDQAADSLSAVYTYFDPDESRYSLGTFAILRQVERGRALGLRYLYLGMYVAENRHLNYKAKFLPQQRLSRGRWIDFDGTNGAVVFEPDDELSTRGGGGEKSPP